MSIILRRFSFLHSPAAFAFSSALLICVFAAAPARGQGDLDRRLAAAQEVAAAPDLSVRLDRHGPALQRSLTDPAPAVQRLGLAAVARLGFARLGEAAPPEGLRPLRNEVLALTSSPDPEVRREAARAAFLAFGDVEGVLPVLLSLLDDPERRVQVMALEGIQSIGATARPAALGPVLASVHSARWRASETFAGAVVRTLGALMAEASSVPSGVLNALGEGLVDERRFVRQEAMLAIAHVGAAAAPLAERLRHIAEDPTEEAFMQQNALAALRAVAP